MRANNVAVGMMDPAYFIGRKQILDWANEVCCLKLQKIEETANGAVACQIFDCLFPGVVPMNKVNWGAQTDYEFIQNYKILQKVFTQMQVDKSIEVNRLIRARYQDNLEFMQWLKKFYELNLPHVESPSEFYDAISRRRKGKGVEKFKPASNVKAIERKPKLKQTSMESSVSTSGSLKLSKKASPPSRVLKITTVEEKEMEQSSVNLQKELEQLKISKTDLVAAKTKMEKDLCALETERDFYFKKLREVEIFLQDVDLGNYNPDTSEFKIVKRVLTILYKVDDDAGSHEAEKSAEMALEASKLAKTTKSFTNVMPDEEPKVPGVRSDKESCLLDFDGDEFVHLQVDSGEVA